MLTASLESRQNLCNLLGYAEEILKAGERVVSDLAKDALATFHEAEVLGLEGVIVPTHGGDGWLRVSRLQETMPPQPEGTYLPWLAALRASDGSFEPPRLVETCLASVSIEDASDLIEAGLADQDDVMSPKGDRAGCADVVDVLLRLKNMPEFAAAFDD
jgi:hypothetical protein